MANPTTLVPISFGGYDRDEDTRYWPVNPATADTYYTGELIGFNSSTGYGGHMDDSQVWTYLGNLTGDVHRLQSDTPPFDFKLQARWTRFVDMPLTAASSTPALPTNFGDPAYVADSGHVQLSTSGLTNNNVLGMVIDIGRFASTGPGISSGSGINSLTGTGTPSAVRVAPVQPGALLGLLVVGIPGPGAVGANAKTMQIIGGAGALSGTAVGTAGGNGSTFTITLGAGGAQTVASGTAAGGNGGSLTITAGAGGAASGTSSTGNGGVGGSINLVPGAGGTSVGGTAGVAGELQVNGVSSGLAYAEWFQAQGAAPAAGSFVIFLASRAYRVKSITSIFSTQSTSGTATVTLDTGTQAPGAGTALLTGTMALSGTANTLATGTLIAAIATTTLAAGNRLSVTLAGTLTGLAGGVIQVGLVPI